jgi:predicted nucleic acid-binding protein
VFVLDASVVLKWFTKEEDRVLAIEYRDQFLKGKIDIALPDLILYELANVLGYNPNFDKEGCFRRCKKYNCIRSTDSCANYTSSN